MKRRFLGICLSLLLVGGIAGCSNKTETASTTPAAAVDTSNIKTGSVEIAAHGTKSFTVAVVSLSGDTIVSAYLDDFQFMSSDVAKGVPNSDSDFGQGYKDPKVVLASKKVNAEYYSNLMKEKGGATTPIQDSLASIEKYTVGKTVAQLEEELKKNDEKKMIDAVSGSTLEDTKGYVEAIVDAAKAAK